MQTEARRPPGPPPPAPPSVAVSSQAGRCGLGSGTAGTSGSVRAVILGFRSAETLPAAVDSVLHQDPGPGRPAPRVTLVLNGASAPVLEAADTMVTQDRTGRLDLVRSPANLGFAGGCNAGAAGAGEEHLAFVNDDAVAEPGWLRALLDFAETHPEAGVVGGQLRFPDGRVQDAGGALLADGYPAMIGRDLLPDDPELGYARQVDYLTGAAVLVRREDFERVGGFDTIFFPAYFEDTDLCLRIGATGRQCWYLPTAVVTHAESASTIGGRKQRMSDRNERLFLQRWYRLLSERVPRGRADRRRLLLAAQSRRGGHRRVLVTGGPGAVTVAQALAADGARVDLLPGRYPGRPDPAVGVRVVEDGAAEATAPLGIGDLVLMLPGGDSGLDLLAARICPDARVRTAIEDEPENPWTVDRLDRLLIGSGTDEHTAGTGDITVRHQGDNELIAGAAAASGGTQDPSTLRYLTDLLGHREAALTIARDRIRELEAEVALLRQPGGPPPAP